ncbi:MAG: GIY-YIG nuclease family protein [Patescibacteria group bacterium]
MHYVYVFLSKKDDKLYIGYTNDLISRIKEHNTGKVLATKSRLPIKLIYYEAHLDEQEARDREKFLKTGWGRSFILTKLARTLQKAKI